MRKAIFAGCLAVMMILSMSMVLLHPAPAAAVETEEAAFAQTAPDEQAVEEVVWEPAAKQERESPQKSYDKTKNIRVLYQGEPVTMLLRDYLTGVVLAEMPASFAPAALEAQAVAARTFVLRQQQAPKHEQADVCGDGSCCQQYLSEQAAREKLGAEAERYLEKVRAAVDQTDGLVITYEGKPIEAVYFSCSGGATEDAAAVWGGEVPYLQSVESPGEEESSRYADTVQVSLDDFKEAILEAAPSADLTGQPVSWFGDVSRTEGGGVETLKIGGAAFSGTALRSMFQLRSTNFTVAVENGCIVFDTLGNGHRVGMSQYGAQAMAEAGADFQEILTHYYSGVQIEPAET